MISNLQLKSIYSTDSDDIANSFYVPVLSEANSYKRVSGYFSSAALALFANGIEELYHNNGRYQLLISNQISESDFELIKKGYKDRKHFEKNIEENLKDYSSLTTNQKKNFSNLAYLIEIGVIDIKVGFTHSGLFHSKYGIISDYDNNKIYFSGSLNETRSAFLKNYESITVIKSWTNETDKETIMSQENRFDLLWNNKAGNFVFVKEFNEILESTLINFSKGKIVMDSALMSKDALVIYWEDNKLKIEDNLTTKVVNQTERRIKKLKRVYLKEGQLWNFKENLSFREILEIQKLIEDYGERTDTKIITSETLKSFIESKKFNIEDISRRGTVIKNRDESMMDNFSRFNHVISKEVARNLRPIQSWVSFYMAVMKRAGNFSVPGSGKTAMLYGTYAYLSSKEIDEVDQIVMIGPKSSFKSWKDEFTLVFQEKRKLKVMDIHEENFHPRMLTMNIDNYNLILINYESMQKYQNELMNILNPRTMLIFDEVHKIKKINGVRANIALLLSQKVKYRYILTGTPLPNGYSDAWNFLHILYENEYSNFFGFSQYQLQDMNLVQMENFNEKLYPFYWRVTKKDLNVPKVNADKKYTSIASDLEQEILDLLWRKYGRNPFVLYTRLIQFSSNPSLLKKNINKNMFIDRYNDDYTDDDEPDNNLIFEYTDEMEDIPNYTDDELSLIDSLSVSSKFESGLSKADSLIQENKVVLIWCIFVDTMHKVVERLKGMGHKVALIYGNTSASDREKIITNFQNGVYDVLVTNPHTLAESVSLHKVCHDAIYLEFSFNLTHMLQSRDRIHRLGLKDTDETNYYYYFLEGQKGRRNTIDYKIYERLKDKETVMIDSIEGTEIGVPFSSTEKDEIIELMNEELRNV